MPGQSRSDPDDYGVRGRPVLQQGGDGAGRLSAAGAGGGRRQHPCSGFPKRISRYLILSNPGRHCRPAGRGHGGASRRRGDVAGIGRRRAGRWLGHPDRPRHYPLKEAQAWLARARVDNETLLRGGSSPRQEQPARDLGRHRAGEVRPDPRQGAGAPVGHPGPFAGAGTYPRATRPDRRSGAN